MDYSVKKEEEEEEEGKGDNSDDDNDYGYAVMIVMTRTDCTLRDTPTPHAASALTQADTCHYRYS
jgi:hypothetical protein